MVQQVFIVQLGQPFRLGRFFLRGLAPSGENLALAPLEMISDVRCVDRHEEYFRTVNLLCKCPVVRLAIASTHRLEPATIIHSQSPSWSTLSSHLDRADHR